MPKPKSVLVFLIVLAALAGFLWLYCLAIYQTVMHDEVPTFGDSYVYIANILSGVVGGIVAVGFGQSPPPAQSADLNLLTRNAVGVGNFITDNPPQGAHATQTPRAQEIIGLIYAAVYVILGLAAIVVWVADERPPDLLKNLATVSIGLFIPITTAFFKESEG